jgi:hypothetical protein
MSCFDEIKLNRRKMMFTKFTALLLFATFSTAAFAVDGVTLINQATVQAAGGFPYTISQPGSYKLSGNLIANNTSGIVIAANNVTLDLGGFTLSCGNCGTSGTQIGVGNATSGISGVTIQNGTITGFPGYCIFNLYLSGQVERVKVSGCAIGMYGVGFSVTNSAVEGTSVAGIDAVGGSLLVANSILNVSAGVGIYGDGAVVSNSQVSSFPRGDTGIVVGTYAVVSGNTVRNFATGLQAGQAATVNNNTFFNNTTGIGPSLKVLLGSNVFANSVTDFTTGIVSQHNNACSNGSGC